MRERVIAALNEIENTLQATARRRFALAEALRFAALTSGRAPSELHTISMSRVDALIGQRLRALGLGPVLDAHVDAAIGPEWVDMITANVEKLIPADPAPPAAA